MNVKSVARLAAVTALAAGLSLSVAMPTAAVSESSGSSSSNALLAAMQRDLGLTAEQALARGAQEARAAATEQTLRAQLGSAFGGAWFDESAGTLVAAVTDASQVQKVHAAGAIARVVQRSAAELDALKSTLDQQAASAPQAVTGWYVDVATNSVVAQVLGTDAAARSWAASKGVRVEYVTEAPRLLWDMEGGQAIRTSGSRCSLGFNARSGSTRFVITAGHCTNIGSSWSGTGGTIGTRQSSSFPGDDFGTIRVTSTSAVSTPRVSRYSSGSDVTIAGSTQGAVNSSICRSGSTTGWHCGRITAHDQTVRYGGTQVVNGLTRTTVCAEPGDSGGAYVSAPSSTNTRVQAQGITSGGSGNCSSGGTTFHQPVNEVLSRLGLTLFTG